MAVDTTLLLDTLTGVARAFAQGYDTSCVIQDLTARVTNALAVAGASVSLTEHERLAFVTADSEVFAELQLVEEKHQRGPSVEAARTGKIVPISDLRDMTGPWPQYVAHARTLGIVAAASIPLHNSEASGSLSLYSFCPRSWSVEELAVASVFADFAGSYVTIESMINHHRHTSEQLRRALASRVIIEQAKGIIAGSRGVCVDKAFLLLRKHANDHNASLHATADAVVKLSLRP